MEDTISLILIEPHESNALYSDALRSYTEVFNIVMVKGKGTLEPRFLGGNPVQLDPNNMESLFTKTDKNELSFASYFVSTKANGLRFMLLIGNKHIDETRNIYLVDSKMNFWYIKQIRKTGGTDDTGMLPPIPVDLNVDKCLIDGELLFWGSVKKKTISGQIKEYQISRSGNSKPLIAFLAFDILYGPINPEYVRSEEDVSHLTVFKLGNSSSMLGQKTTGRWPTSRRRQVLEQMFLNPDSPLWSYLHVQSQIGFDGYPKTLNSIGVTRKGNIESISEGTRYNFTILVSPFIKMAELFAYYPSHKIYNAMKNIFLESLTEQYFIVDYDNVSRIKLLFPSTPSKFDPSKGKGLSTDGLIFTPAFENYLVGPWTFCNNKQYKWKPANELTIDFEVGQRLENTSDEAYYYHGLVKKGKSVDLEYKIDNVMYTAVIESGEELKKSSIVECIFSRKDTESELIIFDIIQERYDKTDPNAYFTAISVLNAANIKNELDFLKTKDIPKPSVLDYAYHIKNNRSEKYALAASEALSEEKRLKCLIKKYPLILFGDKQNNILEMIKQKQNHPSYELELRIDFTNPNYNYSDCLIRNFIGSEYAPVPVVKIYNKNNKENSSIRSVYALLGDEPDPNSLLLEETIDKIQISQVDISDLIYNYDFGIILSDEVKKKDEDVKHGAANAGNTEYQNRYTIKTRSEFWVIDIIEYGNGKTLAEAKSLWEQKPRTRIEIEYAPLAYIEDLLKWENETVLDNVLKLAGFQEHSPRQELIKKFQNYKETINDSDPNVILKDLGDVLIKIFSVLDMDVGNNYGEQESLFSKLRKFHNYIKSSLINEIVGHLTKPISLLDISVGKGGDLQKWDHADISKVYGIDPDLDSIVEANKRLNKMKRENSIKKSRDYVLEQRKISDPNVFIDDKYDIVSCQFTLHYFFVNSKTLDEVIKKVSNALKPGGYFIGTTLLGQKIKELSRNNKFKDRIEIQEIDSNSYTFKMIDTATIYDKDLLEYYVDFEKFKNVCERNGLDLLENQLFSDIYKTYRKDPRNKKSLLRDYELAITGLNTTFVFQKVN
jgi:SAM-dependent methyltransferase